MRLKTWLELLFKNVKKLYGKIFTAINNASKALN